MLLRSSACVRLIAKLAAPQDIYAQGQVLCPPLHSLWCQFQPERRVGITGTAPGSTLSRFVLYRLSRTFKAALYSVEEYSAKPMCF